MANSKIFCNVPWAKIFIQSTGHYMSCCIMPDNLSGGNIKELSPIEWFQGPNANKIRSAVLGNQPVDQCAKCYYNEKIGYESGRIRDNYKSFIFPDSQFDRSFNQNPWIDEFNFSKENNGKTHFVPTEYTISLGNECNLACKMCQPSWSSRIADQYQSWGILSNNLNVRNNWTDNPASWSTFLKTLDDSLNISRLILLGGETTINKKFHELVEFLIDKNRTDITLHFITNATIYSQPLVDKLKKFKSLYVEFSIESIESNNHYIRQGSNTTQVISNILKIKSELKNNANFTISSAPQALTVNTYDKLILWALDQNIPIQGHIVTNPKFLNITVLPINFRKKLVSKFYKLESDLRELVLTQTKSIAFGSDPSKISQVLLNETQSIIKLLNAPEPEDIKTLQEDMIRWMTNWDKEFKLDAREYFPEYNNWFDEMNYHV